VAYMVERCRVLGPGERFCLWVQGCPLNCPGCHNPQFLPFAERAWHTVTGLVEKVLAVPGIEGITLLGGEPSAQSRSLARLARPLRQAGLTVMTYSGFTLAELRAGIMPQAEELLEQTDLLLDGPYIQNSPTARPWRGSDNQRLIALTDAYREQAARWNEPLGQQFELRMRPDGGAELLGIFPSDIFIPPGVVGQGI